MNNSSLWWNPFVGIGRVQRDMNSFFENRFPLTLDDLIGVAPVDMYKSEGKLHVEVELPKFSEKEINVEQNGHELKISAKHSETSEKKTKRDYIVRESSQSILRAIDLPENVDEQKIKTTFKNGLLKLEMPLLKLTAPKTLQIGKG